MQLEEHSLSGHPFSGLMLAFGPDYLAFMLQIGAGMPSTSVTSHVAYQLKIHFALEIQSAQSDISLRRLLPQNAPWRISEALAELSQTWIDTPS